MIPVNGCRKQLCPRQNRTALLMGCLVLGESVFESIPLSGWERPAQAGVRRRSGTTQARQVRQHPSPGSRAKTRKSNHFRVGVATNRKPKEHTENSPVGLPGLVRVNASPTYLTTPLVSPVAPAPTSPINPPGPSALTGSSFSTRDGVANKIRQALGDPRITIDLIDLPEGKFLARIGGQVATEAEKTELTTTAQQLVPEVVAKVIVALRVQASDPPSPAISDFWDLRVQNSALNGTMAGAAQIAADDITKVDVITTALNAIYKGSGTTAVNPVHAVRNRLHLHASPETILKMKRDLVRLDALQPQVQLDVSALQLSGKGSELQDQIDVINTNLFAGRKLIQIVHSDLQDTVSRYAEKAGMNRIKTKDTDTLPSLGTAPTAENVLTGDLVKLLSKVGLNTNANRGMSFSETLVFLSVLQEGHRRAIFDELESSLRQRLNTAQESGLLANIPAEVMAMKGQSGSPLRNLRAMFGVPQAGMDTSNGRLANKYIIGRGDLKFFLETLVDYQKLDATILNLKTQKAELATAPDSHGLPLVGVPNRLLQQAERIDNYHRGLAEAYADDIQNAVIKPLIAGISQNMAQRQGGKGSVALLGRTRLVVTSGLQTGLKPTLTSAVDVTQATPFTLTEAKSLKDTATAAMTGLTGIQAFMLAGALTPEPRAFATIAPGVSVAVRPTVLPNAVSARLQIAANFGVSSTMPQRVAGSSNPQPPVLDAVQSHEVQTDADIDALDLVALSSMTIDTRVPRGPFVVPLLGRLPLLGPVFQFPRGDAKVHHYSILLVNTVIKPRAMDIASFYATP